MAKRDIHWVVRLNWRNRSLFFALAFVALGTHLHARDAGPGAWCALALLFLAYPHAVYWRAARAPHPLRAEMHNLLVDGALLMAWAVSWGLPLWPSYMLFVGLCLNLMIFLGQRGLLQVVGTMSAGGLAAALLLGFDFQPGTTPLTTALCMAALTLYLLVFARDGYGRGVALVESRRRMREQLDEITRLQARLREQTRQDPLTGLANRRHLDEALPQALVDCHRLARPLTVVMIDIDHFKRINDAHGHLAGDAMIRELARRLSRLVEGHGLACRYGGEEFLLLLPGRGIEPALRLAQDFGREVAALDMNFDGQRLQATVSCGISEYPTHASEPRGLVRAADQALYAAKLQGRNRVCVALDEAPFALPAD